MSRFVSIISSAYFISLVVVSLHFSGTIEIRDPQFWFLLFITNIVGLFIYVGFGLVVLSWHFRDRAKLETMLPSKMNWLLLSGTLVWLNTSAQLYGAALILFLIYSLVYLLRFHWTVKAN